MKIKELYITDEDIDAGIVAISFVSSPAIEKDFQFFNKQVFLKGKDIPETDTRKLLTDDGNWKFWRMATRNNETPIIETSHEFCKKHAIPPNNIYHIDEIRNWHSTLSSEEKKGWIDESNFTKEFKGRYSDNFNMDQQLYNCRHFLTPVRDINEIPENKKYLLSSQRKQSIKVNFEIGNREKRTIKGVAMIPNILIYRYTPQEGDFYVYFTRETIKKLKDKYGYNRSITIQHQEDITGNAILMDSWIYPTEKNDSCGVDNLKDGSWCVEYKIINEKLWNVIKEKGVKGFSVELLLPDR